MLDKTDRPDQLRSGVGGEVGEMDEPLLTMREARKDLDAKQNAKKFRERVVELEKERVGTAVVNVEMKRRTLVVDVGSMEDGSGKEEEGRQAKALHTDTRNNPV